MLLVDAVLGFGLLRYTHSKPLPLPFVLVMFNVSLPPEVSVGWDLILVYVEKTDYTIIMDIVFHLILQITYPRRTYTIQYLMPNTKISRQRITLHQPISNF